MKRLLTMLLAMAIVLLPVASFAIDYPIETDKTLTIWRVLDGSIAGGGYTSSNDTPGFIAWQEESGIKAEIREFADNNALLLALNGGTELPDIVQITANNYKGNVMGMVNDDLIIEITPEMFENYAPDFWAFAQRNPMYLDLMQQLNGKIYAAATQLFEVDSIYRYWRGFFYREDLLKKAGWEKFPETDEEFYNCLKDLKAAGIATPLVFQGKDDLRECLKNGDLTSPFGLVCANEFQVDGKWHFGAAEPEYKDVLAFMHKLYAEELISVDYLAMEEATSRAMLCNGEAAIMYGNNSRLNTYVSSVQEGGVLAAGAPLHKADGSRAYYSFGDPMMSNDNTFYITADSENVELALEFGNYLFTEKGNLVRNFGTEGRSYEIVDGIPTYTDFVLQNPDGYSMDGVARSEALINWPGIHDDNQLRQRHPEQSQIVAYEKWSDTDHDLYVVTHPTVLDEYLDDYTNLWTDIELYINECRAKFISGEMDVETQFDEYIAQLQKMGMDKVVEYKQATLDAYAAR